MLQPTGGLEKKSPDHPHPSPAGLTRGAMDRRVKPGGDGTGEAREPSGRETYCGLASSAGCQVTVRRPRLKTATGWRISAIARSGLGLSITTMSAGLPTLMP